MKPSFLIDVNLPYKFKPWGNEKFIHVRDINDEWSDSQIWLYAKENKLTIVTKDVDFSNRIIFINATTPRHPRKSWQYEAVGLSLIYDGQLGKH